MIHVSRGEIRTCDKPYNIKLKEEDFQTLGTDAFINNPYLLERRLEKLQGYKHSDCFTCIKLEERGIQSTRSGKEPFMKHMKDQVGRTESFEDLIQNIPKEILRSDHPDHLEISLSNLCNLKCIYCSSAFSSAWEDEDIKAGWLKPEQKESNKYMAPPSMEPMFWEWFKKIQGSLKRIIFIGGEPLFNRKLYEYLDKIYEHTPDNRQDRIWINIISNFSVPDPYFDQLLERIPRLAKKFNLHIEASGEAWGEKSEYIREGLNFNTYIKNIERLLSLKQPNVYFGFQLAVNALCLSSMKQLFEYAFDLQKRFDCAVDFKQNIVVAPEHLSPYILTAEFIPYLEEIISFVESHLANPLVNQARFSYMPSYKRWEEILPFLKSILHGIQTAGDVAHLQKKFADFVTRNDLVRKRNFAKTFPEYLSFLEHCRSLNS